MSIFSENLKGRVKSIQNKVHCFQICPYVRVRSSFKKELLGSDTIQRSNMIIVLMMMIYRRNNNNHSYILSVIMRQFLYSVLYIHYICKTSVRCYFFQFCRWYKWNPKKSSMLPNGSQNWNLITWSFFYSKICALLCKTELLQDWDCCP